MRVTGTHTEATRAIRRHARRTAKWAGPFNFGRHIQQEAKEVGAVAAIHASHNHSSHGGGRYVLHCPYQKFLLLIGERCLLVLTEVRERRGLDVFIKQKLRDGGMPQLLCFAPKEQVVFDSWVCLIDFLKCELFDVK